MTMPGEGMSRILLTVIPGLGEQHRSAIRKAAEAKGFEAVFSETPEAAGDALRKAEIIFGQHPALAENVPGLRWLCSPSAGIDQFSGALVFRNGQAQLTNSSGAYGVTIAEHVVMMLLILLRRQPEYDKIVADRRWRRDLPIRSIRGSRITLAGTGDIGQETALRLRAFSPLRILGVNRCGKSPGSMFDRVLPGKDWETALPETDVLIISLPGTPETRGMLGEKQLSLLPDGAVVINVGRGSVVCQKALEKELRAGRLSAGLDVFEQEPIPAGDSLWACPNLLITPHTAGNMTLQYTVDQIVRMFLEDLDHYCGHQPLSHLADPARGY